MDRQTPWQRRPSGANNLFHPADDAALQAHLDAVGVVGRFREQIPDDPLREGAASLILFPDHPHPHAGCDIGSKVDGHSLRINLSSEATTARPFSVSLYFCLLLRAAC
jgi:hypothetical protein